MWRQAHSQLQAASRFTLGDDINAVLDLEVLDLGDCELSGSVPVALASLCDLKALRLDRNRLGGPLPLELSPQVAVVWRAMSCGRRCSTDRARRARS